MRPRIYIAGPISRGDLPTNIKRATDAAKELILAGYAPLCPALTCYMSGDRPCAGAGFDRETWMEVDLPWVATADAVLRLPGESLGADEEVDFAGRMGIPTYISVAELIGVWRLHDQHPAPTRGDPAFISSLADLLELHLSKGHDYADVDDPLRNYVVSARDNGIEPWQAAQTRLSEKYHRLINLTKKGAGPKHESLDDTLMDLAAMALIVRSLRQRQVTT